MKTFASSKEVSPTQVLWETFLEMMGVLIHALHAQREILYLNEAANMLAYLVATGHRKYSVYLLLYLHDMNPLKEKAPTMNSRYVEHGDFTI